MYTVVFYVIICT